MVLQLVGGERLTTTHRGGGGRPLRNVTQGLGIGRIIRNDPGNLKRARYLEKEMLRISTEQVH
jgi:hypothetical protein